MGVSCSDVTYSSAREEVKSLWRVELPRLRWVAGMSVLTLRHTSVEWVAVWLDIKY